MTRSHLKRYILVGAGAYIIEIATLWGLHNVIGLSSIRAVAISFWVGLVTAFVLQKLITFQNHDKRARVMATQLSGYAIIVAWNYGFTLLMVKLLSNHLSVFIVRTMVILITTSWNFFAYKLIFNQPKET